MLVNGRPEKASFLSEPGTNSALRHECSTPPLDNSLRIKGFFSCEALQRPRLSFSSLCRVSHCCARRRELMRSKASTDRWRFIRLSDVERRSVTSMIYTLVAELVYTSSFKGRRRQTLIATLRHWPHNLIMFIMDEIRLPSLTNIDDNIYNTLLYKNTSLFEALKLTHSSGVWHLLSY